KYIVPELGHFTDVDVPENAGVFFASEIGQRLSRSNRNMRVERQPVDEFRLFAEGSFLGDDRRQVGVAYATKGISAQAVRHLHEFFAEDFLVEADDRIP